MTNFLNNDLVLASEDDSSSPALAFGSAVVAPFIAGAVTEDEDSLYVRRCQAGDMHAFADLVSRHEQRVISIVSRILISPGEGRAAGVASPVDIEDLCQEVFVQAWRALPKFRGDARFSTWLYRIAVNRALKEYNQRRRGNGKVHGIPVSDEVLRFLADSQAGESSNASDPDHVLHQRIRDGALRDAIDSLPEKQRLVVLLHYFEECPCDQIAVIAGCSVGTVWSRLHYACRRLRESLDWMEPGSRR